VRAADAQLWRARLRGHRRVEALYDADRYGARPHPLSRVLVPEPLVAAWTPFARRRAIALQRQAGFDCVITTSPPESVHLIGKALSRRRVPWVADVRDAWTFEALRPRFPTPPQRRLDERLERRWLTSADALVCVSRAAAEDLRLRLGADPVVVPNGWDPELAEEAAGAPAHPGEGGLALDPDRVSLVYTGRFGSYGRDPEPLVRALSVLAVQDPGAAARLELVIAGPLTEAEARLMQTNVAPASIRLLGSLPRERALALQRRADALLLIAQPQRTQLANLKLFEYLASGRPLLALAEGTEAGRIAAEAGAETVRADDPEAIAGALRRLVAGELGAPNPSTVASYSYPAVAERMADAVEAAIAHAGTGH
jgi:glycosyltransferase involved in cell wall biosynthesis